MVIAVSHSLVVHSFHGFNFQPPNSASLHCYTRVQYIQPACVLYKSCDHSGVSQCSLLADLPCSVQSSVLSGHPHHILAGFHCCVNLWSCLWPQQLAVDWLEVGVVPFDAILPEIINDQRSPTIRDHQRSEITNDQRSPTIRDHQRSETMICDRWWSLVLYTQVLVPPEWGFAGAVWYSDPWEVELVPYDAVLSGIVNDPRSLIVDDLWFYTLRLLCRLSEALLWLFVTVIHGRLWASVPVWGWYHRKL